MCCYSSEQSNATVPVSSNTTDINARAKPLNSDTNNKAINSTAGVATSEVAGSVASVNGNNSSASGNGTSSVEGVLRQQLANQFRFVYSAKAAFNVQNLSAHEMFQVKFIHF
jgi:hypothetical protein